MAKSPVHNIDNEIGILVVSPDDSGSSRMSDSKVKSTIRRFVDSIFDEAAEGDNHKRIVRTLPRTLYQNRSKRIRERYKFIREVINSINCKSRWKDWRIDSYVENPIFKDRMEIIVNWVKYLEQ